MPIKSPVLCKASIALGALEWLLSSVMTYMPHQRTFLPEASHAVLTHVRFLVTMGPLMNLQSVLRKMKRYLKRLHWKSECLGSKHHKTRTLCPKSPWSCTPCCICYSGRVFHLSGPSCAHVRAQWFCTACHTHHTCTSSH